jgi:hypothetical protein
VLSICSPLMWTTHTTCVPRDIHSRIVGSSGNAYDLSVEILIRTPVGTSTVLIEVFRNFPQLFQVTCIVTYQIRRCWFSSPSLFTKRPTRGCYAVLTGSLNREWEQRSGQVIVYICLQQIYVCTKGTSAGHGSMHCLRSLRSRNRGFESHSGHGCLVIVCVCAFFCVFVQAEALRRADHPPKESYRLSKI